MAELFGWIVIFCLVIFAIYGLWSLIDEYDEENHDN
jgi:hypothetical protein